MSLGRAAGIVTSAWLKQQLSTSPKQLRILDASWTALKGGKEDYLSKHIPGSQFFDLNQCVRPMPTLARNLPEASCFTQYVQSLGVNPDSQLVVYDRGGILASARTWWTFRLYGHKDVSVLDGGLKQWEAMDNDTVSGEELAPQKGTFQAELQRGLMKDYDAMTAAVVGRQCQVLDARQPLHFYGQEAEPTGSTQKALQGMGQPIPETMHQGHIPGSRNLLEDLVLDPDTNCLLPKDDLLKLFASRGVDLSQPLTTMCYNGHAACLLALASYVCGKHDTSVYYGSWTEWGQRAPTDLVDKSTDSHLTGG